MVINAINSLYSKRQLSRMFRSQNVCNKFSNFSGNDVAKQTLQKIAWCGSAYESFTETTVASIKNVAYT